MTSEEKVIRRSSVLARSTLSLKPSHNLKTFSPEKTCVVVRSFVKYMTVKGIFLELQRRNQLPD